MFWTVFSNEPWYSRVRFSCERKCSKPHSIYTLLNKVFKKLHEFSTNYVKNVGCEYVKTIGSRSDEEKKF